MFLFTSSDIDLLFPFLLNACDTSVISNARLAISYSSLEIDLYKEGHFNLAKQGIVRLELKFVAALLNTVTIVTYAEFEKVMEIDRNRNVRSTTFAVKHEH